MDIKNIIKKAHWINAFKQDLAPQAILLMGLPAAGKSTFINTELAKYFPNVPHVKAFKVLNSDSQLRKVQFDRSKRDYDELKLLDEAGYNKKKQEMTYKSNDGSLVKFLLDYKSFQGLNHKDYWNKTYNKYYASYFGEREKAQQDTKELADKKITGSDIVIVDTTGQNTEKNLALLQKSKMQGYTTSVVYLEIPVEFSIGRDKYRGATEGRSVGETIIKSIASKLPSAYNSFKTSPVVDRYLKFVWQGELVKGAYSKVEDKKKYPYSEN